MSAEYTSKFTDYAYTYKHYVDYYISWPHSCGLCQPNYTLLFQARLRSLRPEVVLDQNINGLITPLLYNPIKAIILWFHNPKFSFGRVLI